jgi:hypothetical protein
MRQISYPYICDECGTEIKVEKEAMIEWLNHGDLISEVRVVHVPISSPKGGCYKHTSNPYRRDLHSQDVTGDAELLKELGLEL